MSDICKRIRIRIFWPCGRHWHMYPLRVMTTSSHTGRNQSTSEPLSTVYVLLLRFQGEPNIQMIWCCANVNAGRPNAPRMQGSEPKHAVGINCVLPKAVLLHLTRVWWKTGWAVLLLLGSSGLNHWLWLVGEKWLKQWQWPPLSPGARCLLT